MKYRIENIDETTFVITEKIGGVHCYLLLGNTHALLIDTGNGAGNLKKIVRNITPLPVIVVNTHAHLDHIGGNHYFKVSHLPSGEENLAKLHTDKNFINENFKRMLPLKWRIIARLVVPYMIKTHKFNAEFDISDGREFDLGGRTIQSISTSGHSPNSMCYLDNAKNYLFCGDTICDNTVLLNLDGCLDVDNYRASLLKLDSVSDANTKFYSGHSTIPFDKSLLYKFIACANAITAKALDLTLGSESGSPCMYASLDGVRIALKP